MSPRFPAEETECQLLSCKKKCFNVFRRLVQRYHMSSKTHGKFILPEELQLKSTWLCGLIPGILKKPKQYPHSAYISSLVMNFIEAIKNYITTIMYRTIFRTCIEHVWLHLFQSFLYICIMLKILFHIFNILSIYSLLIFTKTILSFKGLYHLCTRKWLTNFCNKNEKCLCPDSLNKDKRFQSWQNSGS